MNPRTLVVAICLFVSACAAIPIPGPVELACIAKRHADAATRTPEAYGVFDTIPEPIPNSWCTAGSASTTLVNVLPGKRVFTFDASCDQEYQFRVTVWIRDPREAHEAYITFRRNRNNVDDNLTDAYRNSRCDGS